MKILKNLMILFLLFVLLSLGAFIYNGLQKPQVASYWLLDSKMQGVRRSVYEIINEGYGVEVSAEGKLIVSNSEEFIAGLKEVIYERNLEGLNWKEYFDAGVFKILVRDNFCSIRVDLNKASHHMSRDPLLTKRSLSDYAIRRSEDFFKKGIDRFGKVRPPRHWTVFRGFVGSPDLNPPVLFTWGMNDLYYVICIFDNTPPFTMEEIP